MAWRYLQTGKLFLPDGAPAMHQWYSGYGEYANQPVYEGLADLGPIPRGQYMMTGIELNTHLGPIAIILAPDPGTRRYIEILGRDPDSFRIHADNVKHNHTGSCGCLVSAGGSVPVWYVWDNGDRTLRVESGLPPAGSSTPGT